MNRTTVGICTLIFSFLCMAVLGFTQNNSAANLKVRPTVTPTINLSVSPTPSPSQTP